MRRSYCFGGLIAVLVHRLSLRLDIAHAMTKHGTFLFTTSLQARREKIRHDLVLFEYLAAVFFTLFLSHVVAC